MVVGENFGKSNRFRVSVRKMLANLNFLSLANKVDLEFWLGKILANDIHFAKFTKDFPSHHFALYSTTTGEGLNTMIQEDEF